MEQELTSKTVAIIGAGPAGCICAKFLSDYGFDTTVFDKGKYLKTLLPTGGGKCNLAHDIYDFKELASNYPRGEKFLYSVFSKFSTLDTLEFFNSIGVKTYTREDGCIFPVSNSASEVRKLLLNSMNCKFVNEEILEFNRHESAQGWILKSNKSKYLFDYVVVATGGHAGFEAIGSLGVNIIEPTKSLVGLVTKEDFSSLAGVSINNILFTHKGVSGPEIYRISSLRARDKMPYKISLKLVENINLQELLNSNPHKEIKNLLGNYIPKSLAVYILNQLGINEFTKCRLINGKMRDKIFQSLTNFEITVTDKMPEGEVVTCGGADLREINPKTMESKKFKDLYFCGEVLDIDGFCGGFNLQNCWSTGFVAANSIYQKCKLFV